MVKHKKSKLKRNEFRLATFNQRRIADNEGSDYVLPWTRQTVLDAYRRPNLTVDDIDVFETHDCFTSFEYAAISAFGLTEPGRLAGEREANSDNIFLRESGNVISLPLHPFMEGGLKV